MSTPRGLELQHKTRAQLTRTAKGEALVIDVKLGPLTIFIIANLPEHTGENARTPLAYIKLSLNPTSSWELFREWDNNGASMSRHKSQKDSDYDER